MTKYSPGPKAESALPLNDKITRLASSLAETCFNRTSDSTSGDVPGEIVADAIRAWRDRGLYLPGELFSDPTWGMLLELFHAELEERRVSVFQILSASTVPTSTAIRWLKALEEHRLVIRRSSAPSGTEFVELTSVASAALRTYFREVVARVPRT